MQTAGKRTRNIGYLLGYFITPRKAHPLAFKLEVGLAHRRLFRLFCTRRGLRRVLVAFTRLRGDDLQHALSLLPRYKAHSADARFRRTSEMPRYLRKPQPQYRWGQPAGREPIMDPASAAMAKVLFPPGSRTDAPAW